MTTASRAFAKSGLAVMGAMAMLIAPHAHADFGPPKPKIDCTKPANKNKPACKDRDRMSDDEIFNSAYWMARKGQYREALAVLVLAKNKEDPRILNATGFATRKLGNVEGALPFYLRALEIDPNYAQAREYLGEAYLTKGDVAGARAQLAEIEARCGRACTSFAALAERISSFKAQHGIGG
jgi:tetratricopeptide (TPR) repeat protein